MTADDLLRISRYVMSALPPQPSALGFLFTDPAQVDSLLVIGKVCAMRRYLMTLARHWPAPRVSAHPVNYFGLPAERWHEHDEFRRRVLAEFGKIPGYLQQGFLREIDTLSSYPSVGAAP